MNQHIFNASVCQSPGIIYHGDSQTLLVFSEFQIPFTKPKSMLAMSRGKLNKWFGRINATWQSMAFIENTFIMGYNVVNPCPVMDDRTQKVFLFFTCVNADERETYRGFQKMRLCYVSSENFGDTWSSVTDLTSSLPAHCIPFSVGPGHGIQTADGMLVVPATVYIDEKSSDGEPVPHPVTLFSSNSGESWQFGSVLPEISSNCKMAEVWGNKERVLLPLNFNQQWRRQAFGDNSNCQTDMLRSGGGKLADTPPGCIGSVVSFPAQEAAEEQDASPTENRWLVFSCPLNTPDEMGLALYLNKSPGDSKAWRIPCVFRGVGGRSDLAYIGNGWFVCVSEENIHHQLTMRLFHYSDINKCRILQSTPDVWTEKVSMSFISSHVWFSEH